MATPTPAGLPLWPLLALLAALLVASFWIANAIAWILQLRRARRIARKTEQLARLGPAASRNGAANSQQACPPVVPVTILTGFLGAGKTTLLNRILLAPDVPFKVMVLENEVGAISIDHALLQRPRRLSEQRAGASDDGIYVLQNGCMCCLSRGTRNVSELERIVDYLLRISNEKGFDYLVVETTGLADPGPIIETFLRLRASRFRLDAIVAMVDAHSTQRYWSETTGNFKFPVELQRQLLYADTVALNKVDLAGGEEIKRLERAIGKINEEATVYQCRNADLDLTQIINVNTFDAVKFRQAAGKELVNDEEDGSLDIWTRGFHTDGIVTVHFEADASVDIAAFSEWLTGVVKRYSKAEVLRIKGILSVEGEDAKCVVQCVLDTYTIAPSAGNWEKEERRASKLVMIGEQLDREELEDGFRRCLVGNQEIGATEPKKER